MDISGLKEDLDDACLRLEQLLSKRSKLRLVLETLDRDITGVEAVVAYLSEKVRCEEK